MVMTKEQVLEVCNEAVELRNHIKSLQIYFSSILDALYERHGDDKDLLNTADMGYRASLVIPDGPAREMRAVILNNWSRNESKKKSRQKVNLVGSSRAPKEPRTNVPRHSPPKKEKEVVNLADFDLEIKKEEREKEREERIRLYREGVEEQKRREQQERGLTPQTDPMYGTMSIGEHKEGEDYL